ncbi:MAG: hybrid sensor histidine kinase/response regulator [Oscillatoriales cyanobacterium]|uniref:histidine kinase n=1 Tax=Microcoleus anatoxicus PTRS2 TaxID=2705321 RepID=A0ABU8YRH7_9CYAN|nr:MAG: hybrid sensor histidine kinase/response regulator [Oscillatoriales cyanobacterium]TAE02876.1 MAG: hybrid sensor histidine kinase/response regulator [Oscillatoriales cyanobacterium]
MQAEQQQRIMGYFIEEAKDHLNTIEQGLLNLQATIEDPELVNEVFRAAHSVKGGAAMLGLTSIQQTAHRLEDSFKILKECSVKVDQQLESLFLRIFDTLQGLLEQLSGPFGLTEELGDQMVRELEPVFQELNDHLGGLVGYRVGDGEESGPFVPVTMMMGMMGAMASTGAVESRGAGGWAGEVPEGSVRMVFESDVPARMREMLQEFKLPETDQGKGRVRGICGSLRLAGEEFGLDCWIELIDVVERAIANPENSYRTLAPIVIKDIKQAQELVLAGRESSIVVGARLRELALVADSEADFEDLLAFAQPGTVNSGSDAEGDGAWGLVGLGESGAEEQMLPTISGLSIDELFDKLDSGDSNDYGGGRSPQFGDSPGFGDSELESGSWRTSTRTGPEVGAAELNTLADLFDGESPDLDGAWEGEDELEETTIAGFPTRGLLEPDDGDSSGDFTDLLLDDYPKVVSDANSVGAVNDLTNLFGSDLLSGESGEIDSDLSPQGEDGTGSQNATARADKRSKNSSLTQSQESDDLLGKLLDEVAARGTAIDDVSFDNQLSKELETPETTGISPKDIFEDLAGPDESDSEISLPAIAPAENLSQKPSEKSSPQKAADSDAETDVDLDLSELLGITSDFLSSESDITEQNDHEDWADLDASNQEIDSLFNMTPDADLDISDQENWLENALASQEKSASPEDSSDSDLDLDALFGNMSESEIELDEAMEPITMSGTGVKSQEAADLVDLFDSVPTGIDHEDEGLENINTAQWLSFEDVPESPGVDLSLSDGDMRSAIAGLGIDLPEGDLESESVKVSRGDNRMNRSFDDENTFDLLEDMFGEGMNASADEAGRSSGELEASVSVVSDDSWEENGADLFDGLSAMTGDDEDDLFEVLSRSVSRGDLEVMSSQLSDEGFGGEIGLLAALETGATLDSADLDGFDDLLDSIDASALVTSELTSGFWDTEESPGTDNSELDGSSLSGFFEGTDGGAGDGEESFDDLESLLSLEGTEAAMDAMAAVPLASQTPVNTEVFSDLEEMLSESKTVPEIYGRSTLGLATSSSQQGRDDFSDLEALLDEPKEGVRQGETGMSSRPGGIRPKGPRQGFGDQTMRVPVKQLDNLSNLMGELVVNRNSLEQDQERMRQFLDNLLHQVTLLSEVSQRTQDFYERSLLEIALLANRQGHRSAWRSEDSAHQRDGAWKPEEMDRFTPFHSLAQEIIELIVRVRESAADIEFLVDEADQVTRQLRQVTTQLQEGLNKARMKPFAETTDRLFRAVREVGIKCGKQAQLQVEGKEILIDKMIVDQLYDPMTHLVNNAITHGIESPDVRLAAGKPAMGRITIRAFHQGNQTVISVSDDGAGIDAQKVKAKAIKQGLLTGAQAQRMTRSEVYELLFRPGFSTQEQATEFAGRGVGMDVVLTSLQEIRGTVGIDSTLGKGTVFTIRLPLVLSISKALCCISDRARIAFPMDGVEDMIDVPRDQVTKGADGLPCIDWRGSILPFRPLRDLLAYHRHLGRGSVYGFNTDDDMISVIVLRSAGNFLAVQVDQVSTEQEIVIKQLEGPVPKPVGIAGATVLGDGRIVAIADVLELIDLATGRLRKDAGGTLWDEGDRVPAEPIEEKAEPTVLIVDDSITVRSLLSITFEKSGYRVEEARDGKEAWEKMKSGLPCDIVFCDIEMPRMDGLELLSRMQKDSVLCELPIAMLTSRGADRHRQMAYGLGAKGYFTKPYLEEQLLDAASRMLKGEVVGAPAVV